MRNQSDTIMYYGKHSFHKYASFHHHYYYYYYWHYNKNLGDNCHQNNVILIAFIFFDQNIFLFFLVKYGLDTFLRGFREIHPLCFVK